MGANGGGLNGVSCVSAASCTAVGLYTTGSGVGGMEFPLAESWDGSTWTIQTVPSPSGTTHSRLDGVSCTPAGGCTATGYYATRNPGGDVAVAFRYYSGTWRLQATASPPTQKILNGISCTSASTCTATGWSGLTKYQPLAEQS